MALVLGTVGCGTGKERPTPVPPMPIPVTSMTQQVESSKGSIAAFAENWYWSKNRHQDGKYGETKVSLDLEGRTVETATLYLTAGYSQQSGSASGVVYISSTQQVQPTDTNHDKGNYWYGNSISAGTQVGSFDCSYTASASSFDVTDFLKNNTSIGTFYVTVENKAVADIGISSIYIKAKVELPIPTPPASAMEALETESLLVAPVDRKQIETSPEGVKYIRGRLTVAFAFGVSVGDVKSLLEEYDLKLVSWLADISVGEVEYEKGEDLEQLKEKLLKETIVEEVQVSTMAEEEGEPIEDDMLVQQFEYLNPIRARLGWRITKGKREIRVAIIDTGVAENHPDLRDNIVWTSYDTSKYDDISCYDDKHHGTMVAGVVGASDGDGGISGVAPDVGLVILKTPLSLLDWALAIIWATNIYDARVINISRGSYTSLSNNPGLRRAVEYAYDKNVVLIASAGNNNKEVIDADGGIHLYEVHYPSSYKKVLAVGAAYWDGGKVADSNYGSDVIYAPGDRVFTTYESSIHRSAVGTSVAAPQVAALAALILSVDDKLTNEKVIQLIKDTADRIDAGGLGRINVYRALTKVSTGKDPGRDELPDCPTDLSITLDRDRAGQVIVRLTWTPPLTDYSGANIYRQDLDVQRLEMLNDSPVFGGAYDDGTAKEGSFYEYFVCSVDSIGQESLSIGSGSIDVVPVTPTPNLAPEAMWVKVGYIPENWHLSYDEAYGSLEGEFGDAGMTGYTDDLDYNSVLIWYERAPDIVRLEMDEHPEGLANEVASIFERDLGYAPDEQGMMTVAGTLAGYAKGYDPDFNSYDMQIVMVKGIVYLDIYARYKTTSKNEGQVMSLIDSITVPAPTP